MKRFMKVLVFFAFLFSAVPVGVWYFGVPDDYITDRVERLNVSPLKIRINNFQKKPFFNFSVDAISLENTHSEVWRIESLEGTLNLIKMLSRNVMIDIRGDSYEGEFSGEVGVEGRKMHAHVRFENIDISDIPFLKMSGHKARGRLSGTLLYRNDSGEVRFVIKDAQFTDIVQGGMYVPMKYFHAIRGSVQFSFPERFDIQSIALKGESIYVRIKGRVINRSADLEIEIMPDPSFPDSSILSLIERYKISDGYYYIPVKRRL